MMEKARERPVKVACRRDRLPESHASNGTSTLKPRATQTSTPLRLRMACWSGVRGTPLEELPHPGAVFSLAWSPDGRLLASGDFAGHIRLWERQQTGPATCVQTLWGHTNWVCGLAFAPDGSRLASASWDGTLKLWELESGRCVQTL